MDLKIKTNIAFQLTPQLKGAHLFYSILFYVNYAK